VIVGSLLLILVAVTLLVLGLANGSSALLISSIAASLLAAVALVVGARQAAAGRIVGGDDDDPASAGHGADGASHSRWVSSHGGSSPWSTPDGSRAAAAAGPASEPVEATIPSQHVPHGFPPDADARPGQPVGTGGPLTGDPDEEAPPDEPAVQHVPAADAALVAQLAATVLVIDGRPRYHLPGCDHLTNRDSEPLPVREAVGLGFTPCARCQPDSALLSDVRRV
jgi:hypothetical protein